VHHIRAGGRSITDLEVRHRSQEVRRLGENGDMADGLNRREAVRLALTGGIGAVTGLAAGYKFRNRLAAIKNRVLGRQNEGPSNTPGADFERNAAAITERHRSQTKTTVQSLRAKYQNALSGHCRVWDVIQKLSVCIDPTDTDLQGVSQYLHVCQVLAAMESEGVRDESLILTALLHDIGKVFLLDGEAPENIVCFISPVEEREPGVGLDRVLFQFGHDEIAYSRLKDHVPEHVAWMIRYHSMELGNGEKYMNQRDREYEQKYLSTFRKFDLGYKSPMFLPANASLDRYRDLVEKWFPKPILF
jgi:hypothetical protein